MKKLAIYLSIIVALFAILFFINKQTEKASNEMFVEEAEELYSTTPDNLKPSTRQQLDDPEYQNIILPEQLDAKLENKEDVFVYFFSPECEHCKATTPKLNDIAEAQDVEIHQYNILEFPQGTTQFGIDQWPALVYFDKGVEAAESRYVGGFSPGNSAERDAEIEASYNAFFEQMKNR